MKKTQQYTASALCILASAMLAINTANAEVITVNGKKVEIDARTGATKPDKDNNPYFISNIDTTFDSSSTTASPDITTTAGKKPTLADGTLKNVFIKNEGNQANSSTMDRSCVLSGHLAKNADGKESNRLAITLWKDGQPLPVQSNTAQPSSSEPFVFAETTNAAREIRYKLGSNAQANLAIGCYADGVGDYFASLKCTRIEVVGQAPKPDVASRIRCKVTKSGSGGSTGGSTTTPPFADGFEG